MFTGIVVAVGSIEVVTSLGDAAGVRLKINANTLDMQDLRVGDSIAVNGACMTIIKLEKPCFEIEVSRESLRLTQGLDKPGMVNLEKSLRLTDSLDGHLVTGHIDGLGTVSGFSQQGESCLLRITAPKNLAKYLAYKGSIVVNGVSLTVNSVQDIENGCEFEMNLIPHTLMHTTLQYLSIGDQVNLEVDLIARYVERILALDQKTSIKL